MRRDTVTESSGVDRGTAEWIPRARSAGGRPGKELLDGSLDRRPARGRPAPGSPSATNQTLDAGTGRTRGSRAPSAASARRPPHLMTIDSPSDRASPTRSAASRANAQAAAPLPPMRHGSIVSPPTDTSAASRGTGPWTTRRRPAASVALVESYRRLADVFHDVLSEQSLDALLERIADTVGELIPHDDLAFYEADEATRKLRGVLARGDYADEVLADEPFAFGQGITGWAVEHREPVLANRADLDPRVRFVEGTPPDPESLIAVPLIARGCIKGALNIYRVGLKEFTEEEFRLAVRFGDAAALALDNAHVRASLELQAQTDPLTGLWNHRAFHERLRNELVRSSSEHGSVALLMLDLDDFKRVNDIYGHAVGDQVLAELADELRAAVRSERRRLPDRRRGVRDHPPGGRPRARPGAGRAGRRAGRAGRVLPGRADDRLDRDRPRARLMPPTRASSSPVPRSR